MPSLRFVLRSVEISDALVRAAVDSMIRDAFPKGDWVGKPKWEGDWWIAFHGKEAVAFAGMNKALSEPRAGYLCCSGVLPRFRGHGLQRRLIAKRMERARARGWIALVTETLNHNFASMNALTACGFRSYLPKETWGHHTAVYWRREL